MFGRVSSLTDDGASSLPFTSFAVRLVAVAIDVVVVLFCAQTLYGFVLNKVGLGYTDHRPFVLIFLFLYFLASWLSPFCATPAQLPLGTRVVSESGDKLSVSRAALRSLSFSIACFLQCRFSLYGPFQGFRATTTSITGLTTLIGKQPFCVS